MRYLLFLLSILFVISCSQKSDETSGDYTDRMAHEHSDDTPQANEASQFEPATEVSSSTVEYGSIENVTLTGYYSEPADVEPSAPGVVLIHEWWGLNENVKMMTRRLAGEGYRVLAVDFYSGQVAETSEEAQQFMRQAMNSPVAGLSNIEQAAGYLNLLGADNKAVMGWCFGGAWTLNSAIGLPDTFDAGVIYYGRLTTNKNDLAAIQIPLLGIFGAEDQGIPVESVLQFNAALDDLEKEADIHIYEGADHAFANPSGNRYEPEAAADAWDKTLAFLQSTLKE